MTCPHCDLDEHMPSVAHYSAADSRYWCGACGHDAAVHYDATGYSPSPTGFICVACEECFEEVYQPDEDAKKAADARL